MLSEMDKIKEILNGKTLSDYETEDITTLMKLAVIVNHKEGEKEITSKLWDKASSRLAVSKDFNNIKIIPKEFEVFCAPELAEWARIISKKDTRHFAEILNTYLEEDTKQRIVRDNPSSRRFFMSGRTIKRANVTNKNRSVSRPGIKIPTFTAESLDLSNIDKEQGFYILDATSFLMAGVDSQTSEWLEAIVNSDILFPETFMENLLMPNKKVVYYKNLGDMELSDYWDKQKIPYLTKDLCYQIASFHPEASITMPVFLTEEAVQRFWDRKKDVLSKTEMTNYFLKFPESLLNIDMAHDINITLDVLNHAPEIFSGTEFAFKFMSRNPRLLFEADERYQLEGLLLSGTIMLNKNNVKKIKNNELREKIMLALNIDE